MKMAASSIAMLRKFTGHQFSTDIGDSKVEYTASMINNLCQQGKKVIVFSQFIETANALSTLLVENLVGTITGQTPSESRSAYLTGLQYSKRGGVIVMTDVGGEGLDMQFVDCIVNHDLPWNPMVLEQRIGRLDRIGRDDRDICVHNILLKDSLDSHIISVLSAKGKLTKKFGGYGQMINSEEFTSITESSFQFQALTSELYTNDLEDISNGDSKRLELCADQLLHVIKELQC
jgi:superfamily II DNA/RNA helicase